MQLVPSSRTRSPCGRTSTIREDVGEGNTLPAANSVPAVKYGMDSAGYHGDPVRSPLVDLSERDRSRAEEYYGRVDAESSLEVS